MLVLKNPPLIEVSLYKLNESECLERNGTNWFLQFEHIKKQQSMRKQPKKKNN